MKKNAKKVQFMWRMSIRPTYSVAFLVRADGLPPSRGSFPRIFECLECKWIGDSTALLENPRRCPLCKSKKVKFKPTNKPMGLISKKAATRMSNAVKWLLLFSHKKRVYSKATKKSYTFLINFITLTLSGAQLHSDEYIKRHMLSPFLKWMKRGHKAGLYIWKAEAQMNGNIHFHITCNTFIHWKSIRRKWNEIQSKHGYMKKWTKGNTHGDPNSTDIHAVLKTEQLAKYMCKYMVKNEAGRRLITGHVWGCSPELTKISVCIDEHDAEFNASSELIARQSETKKLDHATLLLHRPLNKMELNKLLREKLKDVYTTIVKKINSQTYFTTN